MTSEFDPYYYFLGIPPKDQPPDHYRLLGLERFESNLEIIEMAADRQMGVLQQHESGDHVEEVARLLAEVSRVRLCLLNPKKKAAYDAELRALRPEERTAMPYTAEISRANPTCFLFLVDQSASMEDPFGGDSGKDKAEGVADAINRLLQTLVFRCAKGETILDRYFIGVIGYGVSVGWVLGGALEGQALVPVSAIGNHPVRIEERTKKVDDGAGGLVEQTVKFPVWFEPVADGGTPMCEALGLAREAIADFVSRCPGCFPPIVINITDGDATDGDPEPAADDLRSITTEDGNVLLFNVHISSINQRPIQFPDGEQQLPDDHARRLFRMSSRLPAEMAKQARSSDVPVGEAPRGFVFNADLVSVIQFLDIGTRIDKALR